MLDMIIDLFWQGCLILLLIAFAVIIVAIVFAIILGMIDMFKKNKIKNDALKAMIEEFDKLQKK